MARLLDRYRESIRPELQRDLGLRNLHEVPRLKKVVVNVGIGAALSNDAIVDHTVRDIAAATGQRPIVTRARRSVAAFRLRAGQRVGVKTTLRGRRMYEFVDRLINLALPRLRDFRGLSLRAFDGRGNYSIGLPEQLVFPEIDYDSIDQVRGLEVTLVTSAATDAHARRLLEAIGLPFEREEAI